ncbi:MAG: hypothetical protein SX243_24920 [Acidobacteriota bacterium]|nr:hypothetical protein [Acidobacteriota bacterium]
MPKSDPYPSEDRMRQVFDLLERRVEERWGIPVVISDVPEPFTGDLDGAHIAIDYANDVEGALFILIHLFGHTVQWNLDPAAREMGSKVEEDPTEERLAELEAYERQACRYSLTLLHEAGVHDLDAWLADFSHCDFAYLRHFYATGEKRPFKSFWQAGQPLLEPLPIPNFQPTRWLARSEGIVV